MLKEWARSSPLAVRVVMMVLFCVLDELAQELKRTR